MRSYYCGQLRKEHIGETVTLCGWVDRRRDHGGVIFLDLRDRTGIVQIVSDPVRTPDSYAQAEALRSEYVVQFTGRVTPRPEDLSILNWQRAMSKSTPIKLNCSTRFASSCLSKFPAQIPSRARRFAVEISLFGFAPRTHDGKSQAASRSG